MISILYLFIQIVIFFPHEVGRNSFTYDKNGVLFGYPKSIQRHDALSAKSVCKVIQRKKMPKKFTRKFLKKYDAKFMHTRTIWYVTDIASSANSNPDKTERT